MNKSIMEQTEPFVHKFVDDIWEIADKNNVSGATLLSDVLKSLRLAILAAELETIMEG